MKIEKSTIYNFMIIVVCSIVILRPRTTDTSITYLKLATVYEIDMETDTVILEDANGEQWGMYGNEDFEVGEQVGVIMNDNSTPNDIYDDTIIDCYHIKA